MESSISIRQESSLGLMYLHRLQERKFQKMEVGVRASIRYIK